MLSRLRVEGALSLVIVFALLAMASSSPASWASISRALRASVSIVPAGRRWLL
jgi:hypothetical protein